MVILVVFVEDTDCMNEVSLSEPTVALHWYSPLSSVTRKLKSRTDSYSSRDPIGGRKVSVILVLLGAGIGSHDLVQLTSTSTGTFTD